MGGGRGGGRGAKSLIIVQGPVKSSKSYSFQVLLRYMKAQRQLIFITGVRLDSFLTIIV